MNDRCKRYSSRSHNRSKDPRRYYYSSTNSSWNNHGRRNCNVNNYSSKDRSKHDHSKRTQYSSYICWIDHSFFWMSGTIWKINVCRYTHWILAWIRFRNSKIQDMINNIILRLEWNNVHDRMRTRDRNFRGKNNTCNFWNAYRK